MEKKDDQNEEKCLCKYMACIGISHGTKQDIDKESRDSDGTVNSDDEGEVKSEIHKIETDNDVSKDEFNSDLGIDKGEMNGEKRVSFQLDSDQMESAKSSRGQILDSSQESLTESVMSNRDPILVTSHETVHSNFTQVTMTMTTEDIVTFTEETDDDYLP